MLPIIRLAYEGIENGEAWTEMLTRVRDLFRSNDVTFVRIPKGEPASRVFRSVGIDPDLLKLYSQTWAYPPRNPMLTAFLAQRIDGTALSQDVVPYRDVERTEYFQVFREPRKVRWEISASSLFEPDSMRYLSVNRLRTQPRFDRHDLELMELLRPHVTQALRTEARLEIERRHYASLHLVLESLPDAVFMIGTEGALRPLNPAAERFLIQERLVAMRSLALQQPGSELASAVEDILRLEQFLAGGAEVSNPASLRRLVRTASGRRYQIEGTLRFEGGLVAAAVLRVRPAPEGWKLDEVALEREWALTPREIGVARELAGGKHSAEVCRELAISGETLKTHLRNLFQKTHTHGRAELLTVLLQSAEEA